MKIKTLAGIALTSATLFFGGRITVNLLNPTPALHDLGNLINLVCPEKSSPNKNNKPNYSPEYGSSQPDYENQ